MSSFLVPDDTYAKVAKFLSSSADARERAVFLDAGFASAVEFVECLRLANHKGQHEKYNDPMPKAGELAALDVYGAPDVSAVQAVKHLRCIAYQACKWSGWDQSVGPLVERITELIAEDIIDSKAITPSMRGMLQLKAEREAAKRGDAAGTSITYMSLVRCMAEYDAAEWD